MKSPTVSIIMPVYNAEKFVKEALDSVFNQTYKNFELLVINDGSSDNSEKIIKSYKDKRLKLINNSINIGLIGTLNKGISLASGKYIARMDADDISDKSRLDKQVSFMEINKDHVLVGSFAKVIYESGEVCRDQILPCKDEILRYVLCVTCPFVHGSVMIRKTILEKVGGYDKNQFMVEDYGLWSKLAVEGKMANLDDFLYKYRLNSSGQTAMHSDQTRMVRFDGIAQENWLKFGINSPLKKNFFILPKEKGVEYKEYYRLLNLYFAKFYRKKNKIYETVKHVIKAISLIPQYLPSYAYLALVLPFNLFSLLEIKGLSLFSKRS